MKYSSILGPLLIVISCNHTHISPSEVAVKCALSSEIFEYNKIAIVSKETKILANGEFEAEPYKTSDKGCIIVPKGSSQNLAIHSETHGKIVKLEDLRNEKVNTVILQKLHSSLGDGWAYCGESLNEGEMFLKFKKKISTQWVYEDTMGRSTIGKINDLNCARVPKISGRIKVNNRVYSTIYEPKTIVEVKESEIDSGDFWSICKNEGQSNPIIAALIKDSGSTKCNEIFNYAKEQYKSDRFLVLPKGEYKNLSALKNLEFESIKISGEIFSLYGLKNKNTKRINLSGTKLYFLENLPTDLVELNLSRSKIDSLASFKHGKVEHLNLLGSNIKTLNTAPKVTESITMGNNSQLSETDFDFSNVKWIFLDAESQMHDRIQKPKAVNTTTKKLFLDCKLCVTDTAWLNFYPKLEHLVIAGIGTNQLDFSKAELNDLTTLSIKYSSKLEVLEGMENCPKLESLNLRSTLLKNLNFLSNAPNLKLLDISETKVTDLSPLTELSNLEELTSTGNHITICPTDRGPEVLRNYCVGLGF